MYIKCYSAFVVMVLFLHCAMQCQASADKMTIDAKNGEIIEVINFVPKATAIVDDVVYIVDNENMCIKFQSLIDTSGKKLNKSVFIFMIEGNNLKEVRKNQKIAEDYLLNALGINKADACKLRVNIVGPNTKHEPYYYSLPKGLSFCPGGELIRIVRPKRLSRY